MKTRLLFIFGIVACLLVAYSARAAGVVTSLTLFWVDEANPPPQEVVGYEVLGKQVSETEWVSFGTTTEKFFKFTELAPGLWHFTVRAINQFGLKSPDAEPSFPAQISVFTFPAAPTKLSTIITNEVSLP